MINFETKNYKIYFFCFFFVLLVTYPLPIRNLGEVVAVTKYSPFGFHSKCVVSGHLMLAIFSFILTSQISTFPGRLPKPAKTTSAKELRKPKQKFS